MDDRYTHHCDFKTNRCPCGAAAEAVEMWTDVITIIVAIVDVFFT